MLVSTGDIHEKKYQIIEVVFAYGSSIDGFLKTANPMEAYKKVTEALRDEAKKHKGDAVIYAHFDYRVAAKAGCDSS